VKKRWIVLSGKAGFLSPDKYIIPRKARSGKARPFCLKQGKEEIGNPLSCLQLFSRKLEKATTGCFANSLERLPISESGAS